MRTSRRRAIKFTILGSTLGVGLVNRKAFATTNWNPDSLCFHYINSICVNKCQFSYPPVDYPDEYAACKLACSRAIVSDGQDGNCSDEMGKHCEHYPAGQQRDSWRDRLKDHCCDAL